MIERLLTWIVVGFIAQLIDGGLGVGYGITSTTALMSVGIYPTIASASVHASEVFTTFASGASHLRLGNVRKDMILSLVVAGAVGGVLGAYTSVSAQSYPLSVAVASILLVLGILILVRFVFHRKLEFKEARPRGLAGLGFLAAFVEAIAGGGWGTIATSSLVSNGMKPCMAIGSVNFAEFFVTIAVTASFLILLGPKQFEWEIAAGLIVGGVICSPLSAVICKRVSQRAIGLLVGVAVILLQLRTILLFLGIL